VATCGAWPSSPVNCDDAGPVMTGVVPCVPVARGPDVARVAQRPSMGGRVSRRGKLCYVSRACSTPWPAWETIDFHPNRRRAMADRFVLV
jgi:hypothetical protein